MKKRWAKAHPDRMWRVKLLRMAAVCDRDKVVAGRGRQASEVGLRQKGTAVSDHRVTDIIDHVLLVKRVIVKTELVESVDTIVHSIRVLLVWIPV